MNNTANPSRTDAPARDALISALRVGIAGVILSLLLVSFTPYVLEVSSRGGNVVNQLGYTTLAALAIIGHLVFTDQRVLWSFARPAWLIFLVALLFSTTASYWPSDSLRAVLFTMMAMIAVSGVLCLPTSGREFRLTLAIGALAVLGLSYFGVVAFPAQAVHDGAGMEPQHAGLWRGIFSHKNVAGPVMAMLVFVGVYIFRGGDRWLGAAIAILAAVFVLKTGSKTTLALTPVVAAIVLFGGFIGGRLLPVMTIFVAVLVTGLFTLGAAIWPQVNDVLQSIAPGASYTGRLDLWRFSLNLLEPNQWRGFGPETFWLTDHVFRAEKPFELSWDMRLIVNSHSAYLELALWGGWPLLALSLFVLIFGPLADYLKTPQTRENRQLADLCLMVLGFGLLNAFLEAFFLNRANPVWVMTWLSIMGLHLARRFRIE